MQLILTKDVERLGKMGDIVNVKPGYARNFLLPRGMAMCVTPATINQVNAMKKRAELAREERERALRSMIDRLQGASCVVAAHANEEGHLFGSIGAAEIAKALGEEGFPVEEGMVVLPEPIRELGVYEVTLRVRADLTATCKVWVVAE